MAALRAVAGTPGGLRRQAYPSTMPVLARLGLVEERPVPRTRHSDGSAWFLTGPGREAMRVYGWDEA
ncbi:hypothetical protein [Methylobacterium aerolatum]|uniref:Uncharacterized protein n=1 Tax=Methylobacterium aerolatum TaxID=418708 RepID=A0ABU0I607_9HYPH|nr:hypothetical protein [Methylobacterium aerolatum]MDQ0450053.1 hypothetical protein [Methylobacterium aerolatum]GJD37545.1 hypothetical protein FMGBMHLM_4479 [Methylobacterium aerolatum]